MGGLYPVQVYAVIDAPLTHETQQNPEANLSPNVPLVAFLGSVEIKIIAPVEKKTSVERCYLHL